MLEIFFHHRYIFGYRKHSPQSYVLTRTDCILFQRYSNDGVFFERSSNSSESVDLNSAL